MKTKTKEITSSPGINKTGRTWLAAIFRWPLLLALLTLPQMVQAQWTATVGAQTDDKGIQALAFLPNEIWIHAGDSITWTFQADETHTVTFLRAGQVRPDPNVGCPGFSSDPAIFDGSTCVTTPAMVKGQTFAVIFPVAGNFKLTCLVHVNMDGRIHVLPASEPLPHTQAFYDVQAASQSDELLSDGEKMKPLGVPNSPLGVTAGIAEITGTAGGTSTVAAARFSHENIRIHAGQTVEWDNQGPVFPHTITFGQEPVNPGTGGNGYLMNPSPDVTVDQDGARHAIITSTSDSTHSGFIIQAPQERRGLPQAPLGVTRFRVTFPNSGIFPYICALHDEMGMVGQVTVTP
jgi:plastocyanin